MPDVMAQIAGDGRPSQFVTAHAGDHGDFLFLPESVPFLHLPVADGTLHPGVQMFLMAKEDKIGKLI